MSQHTTPPIDLRLATEADLPALVTIQSETFKDVTIEKLVNPDKPSAAYRQRSIDAHRHHLLNDPGLKIIKVITTKDPSTPDGIEPANSEGSVDERIVAFCMFYLPHVATVPSAVDDALTPGPVEPQLVLPLPLRPRPLPISFPHITDAVQRALVENHVTERALARQALIAKLLASDPAQGSTGERRTCGFVRYMCVLPEYQGRGIGHALMRYGCDLFDSEGVDAFLEASAEGERLYRQFGFEVVGQEVLETELAGGWKMRYAAMWREAKPRMGVERGVEAASGQRSA